MEQFSEGDFIRIKDIQKYSDSLMTDENLICQISAIENGMAKITVCKQMISICDLDPVLLSSKPDSLFYSANNPNSTSSFKLLSLVFSLKSS